MTRSGGRRRSSSSRAAAPPDLVPPRYLHIPDYDPARTLGPEVAAVATLAGFPPDPEQRMLLDAAFALDKHGRSVAFEVVVIAPRQNLKTGLFKQGALGQLFVRDERLVVWSAHEFDTANEALNDLETLIDGSDILRKRVRLTARNKVASHGAVPEIRLTSGARLKVKTRTSGGGRGLSGRKVFLDEGYALQAGQVGALMPIMLAQPDPQVWIGSSACRPESAVLWDIVQRGRAGNDPRMIYAEWCAPPPEDVCEAGKKCDHARGSRGCACDDEQLLLSVHSAITRERIQVQTVTDLRKSMPPEEYGREVMGWHDEPELINRVIDPAKWAALADEKSERDKDKGLAIGVDIAPLRDYAAISIYGRRVDDIGHARLIRYLPGTAWLVDEIADLRDALDPIAVGMGRGTYASLGSELEQRGITVSEKADEPRRGDLVVVAGADMAAACGHVIDDVRQAAIRYIPEPQLDAAVAAAKAKPTEAGGVAWARKDSDTDISPLVSVSVARRAYELRAHLVQNEYDVLDSVR